MGSRNKTNTKEKKDPLLLLIKTLFVIILIVTIGTIGYRIFGNIQWIDAFHNASLVFTATTIVEPVNTYSGKIFSSIYNIICAVFVLLILGVIVGAIIDKKDFTGIDDDDDN